MGRWLWMVMAVVMYAAEAQSACAPCSGGPASPPPPLSGGLALEPLARCQCDMQVQFNNNATKLNTACTSDQDCVLTGTADWDGGSAATTRPFKGGTLAARPATCTVRDTYWVTNPATQGQNLFGCTATNTWTLVGDGGSGGAVSSVFGRTGAVTAVLGDYTISTGGTGSAPSATDQELISDSTSAATWRTLPTGGTNGCSGTTDKPLWNSATNTWSCGTDQTGGANFDPTTTIDLYEEFAGGNSANVSSIGGEGELGWSELNETSACVIAQDTTTAGRWGIVKVGTGAALNDGCMIFLGTTTAVPQLAGLDTSSNWTATFSARLPDNTSVKALLGFGGAYSITTTPSNFIGVRYDTSSDTNWMCMSCTSGPGCTTISTGVAGGNTTFHRFKLQRVACAQGDCLRCTVDAAAAVDVPADMPSSSMRALFGVSTRTTLTKSVAIDYWRYVETGLSR